ncbi:septation protein SpoVG family protein [Porcincola intestinalis]|uniref:septation protein SpoVG family protein n=1 Tax=Porcincola intestinalis TaxID=2606632 RepID=UPI002A826651|nr:septation protein SpoVG family protein [Porcincola intestinalis]MDY4204178.1 septation protein SpoVG family protein [Porcincola intestinalis]
MNIRADMKPIFSDKILASGDVYLDEKIVIHNVKVIQADKDGKTYSFVSFPEKLKGDKWEPVVMIKDKDLRKAITDTVNKSVVAQMKVEKEPLDLTVEVRLYEQDETRGYATVNYGGLVKIDGVRIFERDGELRVSYPYEKNGDRYQNIAGPVSPGIRKAMTEMIVKAYQDKKLEQEKDIGDVSEEAPVPDGRSL